MEPEAALIARLRAHFADRRDVAFAYLFGSRAHDTARSDSDLDVAVGVREGVDHATVKLDLLERLMALSGLERVDLVVLDRAPLALRFIVLKEGIALKGETSPERAAFQTRTLKEYWDWVPKLRVHEDALRRRIDDGQFGA